MSSYPDLDRLVDNLTFAEQALAAARDDFRRLRDSVDTAGEIALWERVAAAESALRHAIDRLDEIVYVDEPTADDDRL